MRKISIDKLNEMVDSQYSLVTIISKRARQIIEGSEPLIKTKTIKPVSIAIEEFYDEKFEAIYDYDKYKKTLAANSKTADETTDIDETTAQDKSDNQSNDWLFNFWWPNPIYQSVFSEKWLVGQTQHNPNLHDQREWTNWWWSLRNSFYLRWRRYV